MRQSIEAITIIHFLKRQYDIWQEIDNSSQSEDEDGVSHLPTGTITTLVPCPSAIDITGDDAVAELHCPCTGQNRYMLIRPRAGAVLVVVEKNLLTNWARHLVKYFGTEGRMNLRIAHGEAMNIDGITRLDRRDQTTSGTGRQLQRTIGVDKLRHTHDVGILPGSRCGCSRQGESLGAKGLLYVWPEKGTGSPKHNEDQDQG